MIRIDYCLAPIALCCRRWLICAASVKLNAPNVLSAACGSVKVINHTYTLMRSQTINQEILLSGKETTKMETLNMTQSNKTTELLGKY